MKLFSFIKNKLPHSWLYALFLLMGAISLSQQEKKSEIMRDIGHTKALNEIIQREYKQLGSLTNILEYLGQALNKGSITIANPLLAREWIKFHLDRVKSLEKQLNIPLTEVQLDIESHLYAITVNIEKLTTHLLIQLNNKLQTMSLFEEAVLSDNKQIYTISEIELMLNTTEQLIERCKVVANEIGLSTANIIARRLDELNYRYKLIPRLMGTVLVTVSTVGIIYCLPDSLIPGEKSSLGFINKIKRALGERPKTKDDREVTQKEYNSWGILGKIENMLRNKSTQEIFGIIGMTAGWAFGKQMWDSYEQAQKALHNQWEKLKGFTVKDEDSNYRIIEDLTLDDERIIGFDSEKEVLNQLADYVIDPEMYDRSNSNPAKSILLIGDSGCGKTLLAQALSGTTNKKMKERGKEGKFGFVELKWSDIVYSKDGIKTALDKLKRNAPCFGFIDELHLFPLQTNGGGYSETLSQFLTQLSGLNSENDTKHQVILIGATNRPDSLDQALLRTGRFGDIVIRCNKPNYALRKKYFEVMFKRNTIDTSRLDLNGLTRQTENCTYSDLDAIVKNARFSARSMAQGVSQRHLQDKIDTLVRRIKKEIPYTEQEKKVIATHLAGHALLYSLAETAPQNKKMDAVTVYATARKITESRLWDPRKEREDYVKRKVNYGALFTYHESEILQADSNQDQLKLAKIKLAGAIAEKMILKTSGSTYRPNDRLNALKLIKKVLLNGIPETSLSKQKKEQICDQAYRLLEQYEIEVTELLQKNMQLLTHIAEELEQKNIVTATEIEQLKKRNKL